MDIKNTLPNKWNNINNFFKRKLEISKIFTLNAPINTKFVEKLYLIYYKR